MYHELFNREREQVSVHLQLVVPPLRIELAQAFEAELHELSGVELLGAALVLEGQQALVHALSVAEAQLRALLVLVQLALAHQLAALQHQPAEHSRELHFPLVIGNDQQITAIPVKPTCCSLSCCHAVWAIF
jgi:hypothetical protein